MGMKMNHGEEVQMQDCRQLKRFFGFANHEIRVTNRIKNVLMQDLSPWFLWFFLRRMLLILLLVPALCALLPGCARADFPPFDHEKAKQLSPEKRRAYDVIFFNEVVVWNMNSNRYGKGVNDSFVGRIAEFRRMAGDGYLPAYVALRLLDIEPAIKGARLN